MFPQQDADNSPATDNKHLPHNTPMTPMNTLNRTLMALALAGATLTAIAQSDDGGRPPVAPVALAVPKAVVRAWFRP